MGLVVAGLVPIQIPLIVSSSGKAFMVGLVVAAISLGGLTSPLWGVLADRARAHRALLAGGMLVAGAGLAAFALTRQPAGWILLAVILGLGAAGAGTVANLFVVEAHPQPEWDERIGWLQTFYGVGQVAGLLLAGALARLDLRVGLWAAAALSILAAAVGWLTTRTPPAPLASKPTLLHPARHAEAALSSPQRLFHMLHLSRGNRLAAGLRSPFGIFLLAWLLAYAGAATAFSQYPILMRSAYGVTPEASSIAFSVIAAIGLGLYSPGGAWSDRRGPALVLRLSTALRLLAFAGLLGLAHLPSAGMTGVLALVAFGFVVWAWSLISVSGTALAARLSPSGEGQGLGMFNAVTALAGILGALLGGWAAGIWGYRSIPVLACLGVALGLGLTFLIGRKAA